MLLTNDESLTYNQNDSFAFFLKLKLKLLSTCCVFKVRQYTLASVAGQSKIYQTILPACCPHGVGVIAQDLGHGYKLYMYNSQMRYHNRALTRLKPVFGVSEKAGLKPISTATENS